MPAWSLPALAGAARALPPAADSAVAGLAAWIAGRLRPERERAARENAALLFPAAGTAGHARLARASGAAYARFVLEYLRSLTLDPGALDERVRLEAHPALTHALDAGRGLAVCTAHVGNWELGARALAQLGRPVTAVARPQYLPAWRGRVRVAKESSGIRTVAPEDSAPALLRALRRGEVVGFLVDGDGYARGRRARVAGHDVLLPAGPARLAARSGAVLAGGLCLRREGFRFVVPVAPLAGTESAAVADADRLHDAVAAWLERTLLAHPGAWCIFRPFFADRDELAVAGAAAAARSAP